MDQIDVLAVARRIQAVSSYREKGWEDLDQAATIIRQQVLRIRELESIVQNVEMGMLYLNSLIGKVH